MADIFSRAKEMFPDESDDAIQQGIQKVKSVHPDASDDQVLQYAQSTQQQMAGGQPAAAAPQAQAPQPSAQPAAPTSAIQNPQVKQYIQSLYGDKFSDSARQKLVDENASDASSPNVSAALAALGAGLQGGNAAEAGQSFLKNQQARRDAKLSDFDKSRAGKVADYDLNRKMTTDVKDDATLMREKDPKSQESQLAQTLAKKMLPNKDFSDMSASQINASIPSLEKIYAIEQKKLDRQQARADKNKDRVPEGTKALDRTFAKEYDDWTSGGEAAVDKNLQRLKEAKDALAKHKDDTFGTSGRITGRLPDFLRGEEGLRIRQDVHAAAQGALKATLGAQFTEKEGERIMAASYDEKLSPAENIKKIDTAIKELATAKANKDSKVSHFEQNGTLAGFKSAKGQSVADNSGGGGDDDEAASKKRQDRIAELKKKLNSSNVAR